MYHTKESVISINSQHTKKSNNKKIVIAVRLYYIYNESFQQEQNSVFNKFLN